jgi:DNA-binding transcriptional LysR family regulator
MSSGKGIGRIDSRRLETFRAVALCGQVSEASRRLNLSQPAVTAQIRQLEEAAGHALFLRHATGMRLTAEGMVLLDLAQRMHSLLEEAEGQMTGAALATDPLLLGCSTTLAAYVFPGVFGAFLEQQGPRAVRLEVGNTDQVLGWVREGRVPLGAVEGLSRAPGLRLEPFMEDELFPVRLAHPADPGKPRVGLQALAAVHSLADLAGVPILWREPGSGTRVVIERALAKAHPGLGPRPTDLILGHTEAIKGAVLAGLGIGFLSSWSIRAELRSGTLEVLNLPGLRIHRTFSWVHSAGSLPAPAESFRRFANRTMQGSLGFQPGAPSR